MCAPRYKPEWQEVSLVVQAAIAKHKASEAEWAASSIKWCAGACEEAARLVPVNSPPPPTGAGLWCTTRATGGWRNMFRAGLQVF